ncbi:Protein of unknown function [Gryllus bimaculatus]|nr:Protein of unknown function [Gryllus bimaculatus]
MRWRHVATKTRNQTAEESAASPAPQGAARRDGRDSYLAAYAASHGAHLGGDESAGAGDGGGRGDAFLGGDAHYPDALYGGPPSSYGAPGPAYGAPSHAYGAPGPYPEGPLNPASWLRRAPAPAPGPRPRLRTALRPPPRPRAAARARDRHRAQDHPQGQRVSESAFAGADLQNDRQVHRGDLPSSVPAEVQAAKAVGGGQRDDEERRPLRSLTDAGAHPLTHCHSFLRSPVYCSHCRSLALQAFRL